MTKLRQIAKKTLIALLYTYILGIIVYLVLRLIFEDRFWWLSFINSFSFYLFLPMLIILPISIVLKQKRLSFFSLILLSIGILWTSSYFLPKFPRTAAQNDTTLRIVTFNVWGNNTRLVEVEQYLHDL